MRRLQSIPPQHHREQETQQCDHCLLHSTERFQQQNATTAADPSIGLFHDGRRSAKVRELLEGTPVAQALSNPPIGAVVGGSSAGLAVQGQFLFDALRGGVTSEDALKYPTDSKVSLARDFLRVDEPWMHGVITDTHFKQRDRMGRLVTFVARVAQAHWERGDHQPGGQLGVLGVGISEHTALLVDPGDGSARFVGVGPVYFLSSGNRTPTTCEEGKPLSWTAPGVDVWRWNSSSRVAAEQPGDVQRWKASTRTPTWSFSDWSMHPPSSGTRYQLRVDHGILSSTQQGGRIY